MIHQPLGSRYSCKSRRSCLLCDMSACNIGEATRVECFPPARAGKVLSDGWPTLCARHPSCCLPVQYPRFVPLSATASAPLSFRHRSFGRAGHQQLYPTNSSLVLAPQLRSAMHGRSYLLPWVLRAAFSSAAEVYTYSKTIAEF